eukprot:COSAG01_NODE_115_length_25561_cov_103.183450_14_plen_327_part_00
MPATLQCLAGQEGAVVGGKGGGNGIVSAGEELKGRTTAAKAVAPEEDDEATVASSAAGAEEEASSAASRAVVAGGQVMRAVPQTFAGIEATARLVQAKGVFLERSSHRHESEIKQWLHQHNEADFAYGQFSGEQLLVAPLHDQCEGSGCEDLSCQHDTAEHTHAPAGPQEIRDACVRLVAGLPGSFREAVQSDAEALAGMCVRLCPGVPWLAMRLEIVQEYSCKRWHQDCYTGRAIITYVGPGTCAADDASVLWHQFNKGGSNRDRCVPPQCIQQMATNTVLLMKGNEWPGIRGKGLTHKSPGEGTSPPPKRLLLKVDLSVDSCDL